MLINIMTGGECFEEGREVDNNMQLLKPKRDLKLDDGPGMTEYRCRS